MDKKLALEILQLLSAVDAMLMQRTEHGASVPEYIWESMGNVCEKLQKIVLGEDFKNGD
jgi:hypothetical protein